MLSYMPYKITALEYDPAQDMLFVSYYTALGNLRQHRYTLELAPKAKEALIAFAERQREE